MLCSSQGHPAQLAPSPTSKPLPRCGSETLFDWKGCLADATFSAMQKKIGVGNLRLHPGMSHFLSLFGEKALAIFMPQDGTKTALTHYHGQPMLSTLWPA